MTGMDPFYHLEPNESSVLICFSAPHRASMYLSNAACSYISRLLTPPRLLRALARARRAHCYPRTSLVCSIGLTGLIRAYSGERTGLCCRCGGFRVWYCTSPPSLRATPRGNRDAAGASAMLLVSQHRRHSSCCGVRHTWLLFISATLHLPARDCSVILGAGLPAMPRDCAS